MRHVVIALTFLVGLGSPSVAQVYFKSTEKLLEECSSEDPFLRGACAGYIVGQLDALEGERFRKNEASCLPGRPLVGQTNDAIINALKSKPEYDGEYPAGVAIGLIYLDMCKSN